jgi:hypothetical protein
MNTKIWGLLLRPIKLLLFFQFKALEHPLAALFLHLSQLTDLPSAFNLKHLTDHLSGDSSWGVSYSVTGIGLSPIDKSGLALIYIKYRLVNI